MEVGGVAKSLRYGLRKHQGWWLFAGGYAHQLGNLQHFAETGIPEPLRRMVHKTGAAFKQLRIA